jgi:hypothetical protein
MKVNMKQIICALTLGAAMLVPSLATAAGKPESVVSLADLKKQLMGLQSQIKETVNSLQQVKEQAKDPVGLPKAVAEFESRFKSLEAQVEASRSQAVVVKARAKAHYDVWQKELNAVENASIREKAQTRFTESREQFEKIIATAERAKEETLPFVSDLKDVLLYLQSDLSDEAVKSLSNTIWKLGNRSKSVVGSIEDVNEQIDRTIKGLPQTAKPPVKG